MSIYRIYGRISLERIEGMTSLDKDLLESLNEKIDVFKEEVVRLNREYKGYKSKEDLELTLERIMWKLQGIYNTLNTQG